MITVFGSINLDLIGGVPRLPRPGETVLGGAFSASPGGKGANQALAAARAGARVRMVGAVGGDPYAEAALALLRDARVDLAGLRLLDEPTGVALILVDAAGENVIAVLPGANARVDADAAAALDFGAGDVLLLQLEVPVPGIEMAARRARAAGCPVILNFAPFRADALGLLAHVTHLVVNESECELVAAALAIPERSTEAQATRVAEMRNLAVVATLGGAGVLAAHDGRMERAAALSVEAIDTVGAGDTFCGYLAAALSERRDLAAALAWSAAAGSLACTRSGAQPSIPLRREVDEAIRRPLSPRPLSPWPLSPPPLSP